MCLSDVYWLRNGEKELVFKNAAAVKLVNNELIMEDILGRQMSVRGSIESVDLMNNFIYLKELPKAE